MGGLAPLLASLLAVDIRATVQRTRRNAIVYAIVGLFVLTAYVAAVAAFAVWLSTQMSAVAALGIVALLSLTIALLLVFVVMMKNRADERRRREAAAGNRTLMMTAAFSALPLLMKSRPLMAAAISGGAALLALRMLGGSSDDTTQPGE
jgi:predicted RND superfamily exporter protein